MYEQPSPVTSQPPGSREHSSDAQKVHYASVIGVLKDDPMLGAIIANIRERRREMDAHDSVE